MDLCIFRGYLSKMIDSGHPAFDIPAKPLRPPVRKTLKSLRPHLKICIHIAFGLFKNLSSRCRTVDVRVKVNQAQRIG